jgi:hypothetical protein
MLMLHLYTSLVFALKSNTELLERSSSGFSDLVKQISTKNFSGKISVHQRHVNFAMKKAAKMVNKNNSTNLVNKNNARRAKYHHRCTETGLGN